MFVEVGISVLLLLYGLIVDLLNLATRPLAPVLFLFGFRPSSSGFVASLLSGQSLFLGVTSTATCAVSLVVALPLGIGLSPLFGIDALLQTLSVLRVLPSYPHSQTMLFAVCAQPLLGVAFVTKTIVNTRNDRLVDFVLLGAAVALQMFAWTALTAYPAGMVLMTVLGAPLVGYVIIPLRVWEALGERLVVVGRYFVSFAQVAWKLLKIGWPFVRDIGLLILRAFQHPVAVFLRDQLTRLWCLLSPLGLPTLSLLLAVAMARALAARSLSEFLASPNMALFALGQIFCILCGLLSTAVLSLHALGRIAFPAGNLDPLRHVRLTSALLAACRVLSRPIHVATAVLERIRRGRMLRALFEALDSMVRAANRNPVAAIISAFLANVAMVFLVYVSPLGGWLSDGLWLAWRAVALVFGAFGGELGALRSGSLEESADSTLAIVAIALSQSLVFRFCEASLIAVVDTADIRDPADQRAVQLALAEGMRDPRMCGRCAFGPVDYTGCLNLYAHHGERRAGGRAFVDNSCPRCGWFVADLERWPYFAVQPLFGHVTRTRVWGELMLGVRAGAKAMLVPFLLLRVVPWPPLAFVLALGFLVPWAVENFGAFTEMMRGDVFGGSRFPPRNQQAGGRRADDDCGMRAPERPPARVVAPSELLLEIEAALPDQVFLEAGACCSVCLDDFSDSAVSAATKGAGALKALQPPIVALRCGHALHRACCEQLVNNASARGLRCPLCREPLSLSGAVSARLFN